jgi:sulfur relay (sulfurtransferase) complex TusBCD TusD component (DsrE family)
MVAATVTVLTGACYSRRRCSACTGATTRGLVCECEHHTTGQASMLEPGSLDTLAELKEHQAPERHPRLRGD